MSARRDPGPADPPDQPDQRDQRAIDSEWSTAPASSGTNGDADADDHSTFDAKDMEMLSERVELLSTKERQWGEIVAQLSALGALTGLPLVGAESQQPTATAWLFVAVSILGPVLLVFASADWLHGVSVAFGRLLE